MLLVLRVLIGAVLFLFLGFMLLTLRRDLLSQPERSLMVPRAKLVISHENGSIDEVTLEPVNIIGRAADNTIRVEDDVVSARHARLSFLSGKQWWLEDLGSRNGTSVNEIPMDSPMVVTDGDVIALGTLTCRIRFVDAEIEADAGRK